MLRSVFVFSLSLACFNVSGQSIQRSTLSSLGSTSVKEGVVMQTCVGQPSPTGNRQGFIQPPLAKTNFKNAMQSIRVYPLPAIDQVKLDFSFRENDLILVYDLNASIVTQVEVHSNESSIGISLGQHGAGRYSAVVYRDGSSIALGTIVITK